MLLGFICVLGSKLPYPAGNVCILEFRSLLDLRLASALASEMFRHKCRTGSAAVVAAARPGHSG